MTLELAVVLEIKVRGGGLLYILVLHWTPQRAPLTSRDIVHLHSLYSE